MPDPEKKPSREQLSKTPSWIMLGFIIGCIFAFTIRHRAPTEGATTSSSPPVLRPTTPRQLEPATPAKLNLSTIEDVFAVWGQYALWQNDRAEVALWDQNTERFSDLYEVLRDGGVYYFRSISRLTRPVVTQGTPQNSPLLFTEPEELRRIRLERGYLMPPDWMEKLPPPAPAPKSAPADSGK